MNSLRRRFLERVSPNHACFILAICQRCIIQRKKATGTQSCLTKKQKRKEAPLTGTTKVAHLFPMICPKRHSMLFLGILKLNLKNSSRNVRRRTGTPLKPPWLSGILLKLWSLPKSRAAPSCLKLIIPELKCMKLWATRTWLSKIVSEHRFFPVTRGFIRFITRWMFR